MSFDLIALLTIVSTAFVLFIGGWVRVDVVGLLVLAALALTGLVTTAEALAGFSSPAVVTVWALFILSAGLTRTGIAHQLGQPLQRFSKKSEAVLIVALMTAASLLSALINTVTVAAILLPSTMELARRSERPPSRLLMPLALGCLLGGPFTGISTPPNILVTDALRNAGLEPFAIFDFTPITAVIVTAGIAFMVLIGRRLLPRHTTGGDTGDRRTLGASYQLDTHIFTTHIPAGSPLDGRTLAESRLGSALYLTVLALKRKGIMMLAPRPESVLQSGDILIVHGNPDMAQRYHGSLHLQVESLDRVKDFFPKCLQAAEVLIPEGSPLIGSTLAESGLRREHRVHVIALHCPIEGDVQNLRRHKITAGDRLLLQGEPEALEALSRQEFVSALRFVAADDLKSLAGGRTELLSVRVPQGSVLADHDLVESRLGNAFGLTVVGLVRDDSLLCMPSPTEKVQAGDLLVLQGSARDLQVLECLQDLEIEAQSPTLIAELESQQIGATEVLLSPRTTLAGQTLAELLFRERYGISVLAVWRRGRAYRTGLQDMPLQFGDALLVYGNRRNLEALARNPDFLVLDEAAARAPRLEKAHIAVAVMLAVLLSAILGFVPISIAAVAGATVMVLFGCLSMEEAYRAIEWKVVFLIAGMLPLGAAIENTGAAQMGASALIAAVGDFGPRWVVAALFTVTVIGTQIIPTAALVVLMTPVALSAADTLGISPHLLMMTVAISASSSFASPLSHPAHLLVMSPGGYRFLDYVKVGVPITIISLLVSVGLLPILWPPHG
ncbi:MULTISPECIES: SLC13 family permease [Desulfococcus]|uniref:Citrate transporter n=1 Tax=Desulfococcus multivorans DSM 2059 TaxID=1121405 RepID=S7TNR9_DESML|nr:SLC13 family permease [Desulfococcus multivorans]AOY57748.1 putative citrate transporter [Desulfococcus multivorans]AQV00138.1 SLC13 family permease [Desulfococcus multivorans]EPR38832.1 Citrate transporter [Desulfococcus multivorans DSM 2059]SJZ80562.1 Di-and tricarboxylate transporters [Desulfococcus multivorans DSM 2059]